MITKYFNITDHIISDTFITKSDKSKPRLDLIFSIYGDLIVVQGFQDCIEEWNLRFQFEEYSEEEGMQLMNDYIEICKQYEDL